MIYTKEERVSGEVAIWAIPNDGFGDDKRPFKYELHTGRCWITGAVQVTSYQVSLSVPAGINLVEMALRTIEDAKKSKWDEYLREVKDLDEQKQRLLLLVYKAEEKGDDEFIPAAAEEDAEFRGHPIFDSEEVQVNSVPQQEGGDVDDDIPF